MIRVVKKNLDTGEIEIETPISMSDFELSIMKCSAFGTLQKDFAGYSISVTFSCREALDEMELYPGLEFYPDRFVIAKYYKDIGRFSSYEYYLDINGKSYYYKDLLEHWAEVMTIVDGEIAEANLKEITE